MAIGIAVAAFAARFVLLRTRSFNPDEFEHLHGAWCISKGLLPYRDYFEHHTPWLHALLALVMQWFRPEQSFENAVACIVFARLLMIGVSALALLLTLKLARECGLGSAAWWAVALLSLIGLFEGVTLQVRPDVPALACLLAGWIAMLRASRSGSRSATLLAGLAHGAAVMFTQKTLFALPAAGAVLFLDEWRTAPGSSRPRSLVAWFVAGVGMPLLATAAFFAAKDALPAFLDLNFALNARWKARVSPLPVLKEMVHADAVILILATIAAIRSLGRLRTEPARSLLTLQAIGWLAGAAIIPIAYAQYFLPLLPILGLLATLTLVEARDALNARAASRAFGDWAVTIVLALLGWTHLPSLWPAAPASPDKVVSFLARTQEVMTRTSPQQAVMDGFSGLGVFRPHVGYYFFPHHEVQAVLEDREIARLRTLLREGDDPPALLVMDLDLSDFLRDKDLAFVKDNYEPIGDGLLWKPRDLRLDGPLLRGHLDIGAGPGDALIGLVWYPPEQDGDVNFRRVRGRIATIRLPIANPRDMRLLVRARVEPEAMPAGFTLFLNDASAGQCQLDSTWQTCELAVPKSALYSGINLLRFRLDSSVASRAVGVERRLRGPMAVDWIELKPK